MKTVFMFPGQGAQSVGMMSDLLAQSQEASDVFRIASDAIDVDLRAAALEGPEDFINQTAITQPLVLTASIAMWRAWLATADIKPDFVCGHSLGEYTAMIVSGVLDLAETVQLVHLRGQLMQQAVPLGEGGMAALLGLEDETVVTVCEEAAQSEVVSAANYNSPGQVVISGGRAALERAVDLAKERGAKRAAMLPVSVPCHCALLKPAAAALAERMNELQFNAPVIPVMQNVNAQVPESVAALKQSLLAHLYEPVRWSDSIRNLIALGADTFVECGPGKVLSGLNKRIDRSVTTMAMNSPTSMENVRQALLGEAGESE